MAWLGGRKGGRRVSVPQLMSLIMSSETASRWARDDEEHQLIRFLGSRFDGRDTRATLYGYNAGRKR